MSLARALWESNRRERRASLTRRVFANFRLDVIHRPGSDLYIVVNEERGAETAAHALVGRGVAEKLNYLLRL